MCFCLSHLAGKYILDTVDRCHINPVENTHVGRRLSDNTQAVCLSVCHWWLAQILPLSLRTQCKFSPSRILEMTMELLLSPPQQEFPDSWLLIQRIENRAYTDLQKKQDQKWSHRLKEDCTDQTGGGAHECSEWVYSRGFLLRNSREGGVRWSKTVVCVSLFFAVLTEHVPFHNEPDFNHMCVQLRICLKW